MAGISQSHALEELCLAQNGANPLKKILIIDDQQSIRMILSMLLSDMGYVVEVGQNGEEGIQLFNDHSDIALVITDIRMPKMDGNEVARHIRASYRANTPLVAITGFPDEAQVNLFDYRLVKPFKLETLCGIVARLEAIDSPKPQALGSRL